MSKLAKTHMGRKPSNFRQGDVRKALQAVRDAGHTPDKVVITTAGEVVISVKEPTPNVAEVADGERRS
jgi:hypothetical protein